MLDLALSRARPHARFVICGGKSVSKSNPTQANKIQQLANIIPRSPRAPRYFSADSKVVDIADISELLEHHRDENPVSCTGQSNLCD